MNIRQRMNGRSVLGWKQLDERERFSARPSVFKNFGVIRRVCRCPRTGDDRYIKNDARIGVVSTSGTGTKSQLSEPNVSLASDNTNSDQSGGIVWLYGVPRLVNSSGPTSGSRLSHVGTRHFSKPPSCLFLSACRRTFFTTF